MGQRSDTPKPAGPLPDSGPRPGSVANDAATKRIIGRTVDDLLADLTSWPESLRELVREHGGKVVWSIGLRVLEYPPTWVSEADKARQVIEAVKREADREATKD